MTFDEYKNLWLGKRIDYDGGYGYQCVDSVKHFADLVHGKKLLNFSGSALNARKNGSPFVGLPYVRVEYKTGMIPPRGAIVFFDKTTTNIYGHVAIAGTSTDKYVYVMEQNAKLGSGTGMNGDEISVRNYNYINNKVGNVLGWYLLYYVF